MAQLDGSDFFAVFGVVDLELCGRLKGRESLFRFAEPLAYRAVHP